MQQRDLLYLGHMLDTAREAVEKVAGGGRAKYDTNEDFRLALAYRVQTIGEAARRVSEESRQTLPEIPWREIVGMRHKIVHDYLGVDFDIVWQVVKSDLPELIRLLEAVLFGETD